MQHPLAKPKVLTAALVVINFDCYLRPSEGLGLRRKDVSAPSRAAAAKGWALNIAPLNEKMAKNRRYDDGVTVGVHDRQWICGILRMLCRSLPSDAYLFRNLDLATVEGFFRAASDHLGWTVVAHGMRHAGPSHDAYVHGVDLLDLQARGRWLCAESVRTYAKPARLLRSLARLSSEQVRQGRRVSNHLHTKLADAIKAVI